MGIEQCATSDVSSQSAQALLQAEKARTEQVKGVLLEEREKTIQENPGYMMIEKNYVYSDYLIDTITVEKSDSTESPQDLEYLFLHPEYCSSVLKKVWDIVCAAPPARKHCRKH